MRIVGTSQVLQADPSETIITSRELAAFETRIRPANAIECLIITNDLERVEKMEKGNPLCSFSSVSTKAIGEGSAGGLVYPLPVNRRAYGPLKKL